MIIEEMEFIFIKNNETNRTEVCKVIPEYPNYAASYYGNIYNIKTGKMLKPAYYSTNHNNYKRCRVCLRKNGKTYPKYVHQLVMYAWKPVKEFGRFNPDGTLIIGKVMINHKDHNTRNNSLTNLEYCDNKYNCNN